MHVKPAAAQRGSVSVYELMWVLVHAVMVVWWSVGGHMCEFSSNTESLLTSEMMGAVRQQDSRWCHIFTVTASSKVSKQVFNLCKRCHTSPS